MILVPVGHNTVVHSPDSPALQKGKQTLAAQRFFICASSVHQKYGFSSPNDYPVPLPHIQIASFNRNSSPALSASFSLSIFLSRKQFHPFQAPSTTP